MEEQSVLARVAPTVEVDYQSSNVRWSILRAPSIALEFLVLIAVSPNHVSRLVRA